MTSRHGAVFSVVIPVYRGWQLTRRLLNELDRTRARTEADAGTFEVVVVDDASGDEGSVSLPPDVLGRPLTVVARSVNGGFGAAVNSGVEVTHGDVLIIVNNDLEIDYPTLREIALRVSGTGWVVAPMLREKGRLLSPARRELRRRHDFAEFCVVTRLLPRTLRDRARGRGTVHHLGNRFGGPDWLVGACLGIPKTVWERVGGFDEGYFMNSEEVDWFRRARALGTVVAVAPDLEVIHDPGQGDVTLGALRQRLQWGWQARRRYVLKWEGEAGLLSLQRTVACADAIHRFIRLLLRLMRVKAHWQDRLDIYIAVAKDVRA